MENKNPSKIGTMISAMRPWSFPFTVISVLIGTFLVSPANVNWLYAILAVAGMVILHGATNVLNDYFDFVNGIDMEGAPTTLYRTHPLVSGILTGRTVFLEALFLYLISGLIGLFFFLKLGWIILAFTAIGAFFSIAYTGWLIHFKYRALGEIAVFLMWGPLMIFATYYIQAETYEKMIPVLLLSIPHGIWVTLVILANNTKDIDFDRKTEIKTVGTLLDRKGALKLYKLLALLLYLITGGLIAFSILPLWSLLVVLSLPATIKLIRHLETSENIPADADPMTAKTGTIFGVLFVISLILQGLVPL